MKKIFSNGVQKVFGKMKYSSQGSNLNTRFQFFEVGFHGDFYLLQLVNLIFCNSSAFVETGTNVGSTLAYVARTFPTIQCFSCEPDQNAYLRAKQNSIQYKNIKLFNETSEQFFVRIDNEYPNLFDLDVLFWLDAHGYGFKWPLLEEVEFITKKFKAAYILIDDFKVPGMDCFGYDKYEDQECSLEYIQPVLNHTKYTVYYPNYLENRSQHHSLRGWGLIEFGHTVPLNLPEILNAKVRFYK